MIKPMKPDHRCVNGHMSQLTICIWIFGFLETNVNTRETKGELALNDKPSSSIHFIVKSWSLSMEHMSRTSLHSPS